MRTPLHILILFVIVSFMSSCDSIYFAQPQPIKGKTINQIPQDKLGHYQGEYYDLELSPTSIISEPFMFELTEGVPSENQVLLKSQGDLFYANIADSSMYHLILGKFYEDKLALYMLEANERTINILKKYVTIEEFKQREGNISYLINPSKKELSELIEMDLFSVIDICTKTDQ